jgi:hypothetical protein
MNRHAKTLNVLLFLILQSYCPPDVLRDVLLVDSLPIITCAGRNRTAKVARELVDKGFCSTKNLFFFGIRLHFLSMRRMGSIPFPRYFCMTPASGNDLQTFKDHIVGQLYNCLIFADKAYCDQHLALHLDLFQQVTMYSPIKTLKGTPPTLQQRDKAANDLYNRAVSAVRQPIESFFNWLIEKVQIQKAQKVRSTAGLLVHIFGKLVAAFLPLIF